MKKNILFIQPPQSANSKAKFLNHQMPLGFLYMAGILEKNNFNVKILDCPLYYSQKIKVDEDTVKFGLFPDQIKKVITEFKPDIVGVSCSFTMFESDSFEILDLVKKIDKKIITVAGGAHISSNPEFVLRNKNLDLAIIGEGELTMLEIAKNVRDRKPLKKIKGTALRSNKKIKRNPSRELIQNLDELEPAWHLIDFKKYFEHPDNYSVTIRGPSVNIVTSRGCPANCIFCSVRTIWGRKWRTMSPKKVADQIQYLYEKKGIRHFRINDDNLTLNKKRIMDICNEIRTRKLDIKWDTPSGVAIWTLDEEVLLAMKKSGYYRITFGIESGCPDTLKYIRKAVDLKKVNKLIDYCHKIGLWVASFFIIGFPYEKPEDIQKTKNFILKSKINFPFVFLAQPYPGTEMYEDFKKEGLLGHGFEETSTFIISKYNSKKLSAKQINNLRKNIYKEFYITRMIKYFNPYIFYKEFASKIRSYEDLKYVFKITRNLAGNFSY